MSCRVPFRLVPPSPVATLPEPVPVTSFRGQAGELCGRSHCQCCLAALFCGTLWAGLKPTGDWTDVGAGFFLTVAACWAVLIPSKFWSGRAGDSGIRRTVMMAFGLLIGALALWLEGWSIDGWSGSIAGLDDDAGGWRIGLPHKREGIMLAAGYLSYFGLAFFALRWWKMADRLRAHRFSLVPILAAGFWAVVLLLVWPHPESPRAIAWRCFSDRPMVSPWELPCRDKTHASTRVSLHSEEAYTCCSRFSFCSCWRRPLWCSRWAGAGSASRSGAG